MTAVPEIPFALTPSSDETWSIDGTIKVRAAPRSDIFVDPGGGTSSTPSRCSTPRP